MMSRGLCAMFLQIGGQKFYPDGPGSGFVLARGAMGAMQLVHKARNPLEMESTIHSQLNQVASQSQILRPIQTKKIRNIARPYVAGPK